MSQERNLILRVCIPCIRTHDHGAKTKMVLAEYLYVDAKRVDSYVEQIGKPIAYDKVPVWKAILGMAGPKVEATQSLHSRAMTRHEKVEALLSHLSKNALVAESRVVTRAEKIPVFVVESFDATRIVIPPISRDTSKFPGVALWISLSSDYRGERKTPPRRSKRPTMAGEDSPGLLCLLEDYQKDDADPRYPTFSAYTAFDSLLSGIKEDFEKLVLSKTLSPKYFGPDVLNGPELMSDFASDPISKLQALGCRPTAPRSVRCLYRIREILPGDYVFAYPLFITAEPL